MLRLIFLMLFFTEMTGAQDFPAYFLERNLAGKSLQVLYSEKKGTANLLYSRGLFEFERLPVFIGAGFGQIKRTVLSENQFQFVEKKEKLGRAVFGFSIDSFSVYTGKEFQNSERSLLGIQLRLFTEKKIQFEQTWGNGFKRDALLLQSGKDVQLGLIFFRTEDSSRNFTDRGGAVSITLNFDFFSASAGVLFGSSDYRENILLSASLHQKRKETALLSEKTVFEQSPPDAPKKEEKLPEPPPKEKETKPVILTLQELLSKKIPLGEAARIAEASKDPKKLKALLESLPKDTKGKVHFLLKEKRSK